VTVWLLKFYCTLLVLLYETCLNVPSAVFSKEDPEREEGKENMANADNQILPLSWDDQLLSTGTKVITARETRNERTTIVRAA